MISPSQRKTQYTQGDVKATHCGAAQIEFIRLPRTGSTCPHVGLSRSTLNKLILPSPENRNKPPVASICLRRPGTQRGVRLIDFASLVAFLRSHQNSTT